MAWISWCLENGKRQSVILGCLFGMRQEKMKGHGAKFPSPSRKSFAGRIPAAPGVPRGLEKPLKALLLDHRSGEKTKGTYPLNGHSSLVRESETERASGGGEGNDLPARMEQGSFKLGPHQRTGSGSGAIPERDHLVTHCFLCASAEARFGSSCRQIRIFHPNRSP